MKNTNRGLQNIGGLNNAEKSGQRSPKDYGQILHTPSDYAPRLNQRSNKLNSNMSDCEFEQGVSGSIDSDQIQKLQDNDGVIKFSYSKEQLQHDGIKQNGKMNSGEDSLMAKKKRPSRPAMVIDQEDRRGSVMGNLWQMKGQTTGLPDAKMMHVTFNKEISMDKLYEDHSDQNLQSTNPDIQY